MLCVMPAKKKPERPKNPETLSVDAKRILARVGEGGGVSFVELHELFPDQGPLMWEMGAPNVILWAGMSQKFVDAMQEARPYLDINPCHVLVYVADGSMLQMPIVTEITKAGFKKPHWLPVTFSVKPEFVKELRNLTPAQ